MSAGPKSILKKRPRAAVEPEAEERPLAPGQAVSDETIHPVNGDERDEDAEADEGDDADDDEDDDEEESDDQDMADDDEFSVGSDDDSEAEDDEDAIREMLEDGQERPAKSADRLRAV